MTRRALISVSDKSGLGPFARTLTDLGYQLLSTGGTLEALQQQGLEVTPVSQITGFPEAFDGRVKTLHPAIHGAILFRRDDPAHRAQARSLGIAPIDLVVVNLYPFQQTVADPDTPLAEAIEQIDIGGPAMVRAAAKNFAHVAIVVDPQDYDALAQELKAEDGVLSPGTRARLARKAFEHTAAYDGAIGAYLRPLVDGTQTAPHIPPWMLPLGPPTPLRYGENPHQSGALYATSRITKLGGGVCLQGKALSYNNLVDIDAALCAVAEMDRPAAVIVKHTNPCGVGRHRHEIAVAFERALAGDPQSAFGGIIALNRPCSAALAERIAERFFEVVIGPGFEADALETFAPKRNLRLLEIDLDVAVGAADTQYRLSTLGVLAQSTDPPVSPADEATWRVVTQTQPTEAQIDALRFLWRVCKHVKSNAIVIGSDERTFGIGAGQMSRVDAVRIALEKSTADSGPVCLASDAFFPFSDNIDVAAQGGVQAIVQPGGSRRDDEVIAAADAYGLAMVLTGRRHFKH